MRKYGWREQNTTFHHTIVTLEGVMIMFVSSLLFLFRLLFHEIYVSAKRIPSIVIIFVGEREVMVNNLKSIGDHGGAIVGDEVGDV